MTTSDLYIREHPINGVTRYQVGKDLIGGIATQFILLKECETLWDAMIALQAAETADRRSGKDYGHPPAPLDRQVRLNL